MPGWRPAWYDSRMTFDGIQGQPSTPSQSPIRRGIGGIAVFSLLIAVVWLYGIHIRHDLYFAAMWTPPLFIGLGFAALEAFFPKAYPPRLREGSPRLKSLKQWRLGLILSAGGSLLAGIGYIVVTDAPRFSNLSAIPCYLCVCAWITLTAYIRIRTSASF
jgi:hypothetical protein